jgi:hypothetical protein
MDLELVFRMKEEHSLNVCENRALRRMYRPNEDDVTEPYTTYTMNSCIRYTLYQIFHGH